MNRKQNSMYARIGLLCATVGLALFGVEVSLRFICNENLDGNVICLGRVLRPYQRSTTTKAEELARYEREVDQADSAVSRRYDPKLGFRANPNYCSSSACYNSQAIRVDSNLERQDYAVNNVSALRIAAFGDSYTHGDEVAYVDSWPALLEERLERAGIDAEVINFGFGGYGIDQAYLRWLEEGKAFAPDIVIHGFTTVDLRRALLIYGAAGPSGTILSKPIFLLDAENGTLRLINSPAIPPQEVLAKMDRLEDLPLIEHQYNFEQLKLDHEPSFLRLFRSYALVEELMINNRFSYVARNADAYDLERDTAQLNLAILRAFSESVRKSNSGETRFIIMDIPQYYNLKALLQGDEALPYEPLLAEMKSFSELVTAQTQFRKLGEAHQDNLRPILDFGQEDSLFARHGHYSRRGNQILADTMFEHLFNTLGE